MRSSARRPSNRSPEALALTRSADCSRSCPRRSLDDGIGCSSSRSCSPVGGEPRSSGSLPAISASRARRPSTPVASSGFASDVSTGPWYERDLAIAATNGAVISLDNLSTVPDWLSDTLCRVSTGLGFSTRTLYENDEETLYDACRPIVINGIGVLGTRSDLLDRTIELELPRIPDDRRQD